MYSITSVSSGSVSDECPNQWFPTGAIYASQGYLQTWKLKLSTTKTVSAAFHLNKKEAKHELKVNFNNKTLAFPSDPSLSTNRSRKFFWHRGAKKLGGTMVRVPIFQMAPVPNIFKLWHRCHFLNGTGVGANFSNGTGAKHFQSLAPVACFEWHLCHTFTKLVPVPIMCMAPVPQLFKLGTSASLSNGTRFFETEDACADAKSNSF